jgi:hypothetical protein
MSFIFDISISKNIYKNNLKKKNKIFLIFFKRDFETLKQIGSYLVKMALITLLFGFRPEAVRAVTNSNLIWLLFAQLSLMEIPTYH